MTDVPNVPERSIEEAFIHRPVLVQEVITALALRPFTRKIYFDCTVGLGGHAEAILNATAPDGKVVGIDRDEEALRVAERRLRKYRERAPLRKGSFKEIGRIAEGLGLKEIDGILFDLGLSSVQLDDPERGFSFQKPGPLDMRMDREQKETAADWVNRLSLSELASVIQKYGEERWAKRIASAIVRFRAEKGAVTRTDELESIIWRAIPPSARYQRIHPATRTFQALRMAVNDEIGQMEAGIEGAIPLLAPGGRLVVISFHSLEDRFVKRTFKKWGEGESALGRYRVLYKKPVVAGPEEVAQNPRARSAKLRALERAA